MEFKSYASQIIITMVIHWTVIVAILASAGIAIHYINILLRQKYQKIAGILVLPPIILGGLIFYMPEILDHRLLFGCMLTTALIIGYFADIIDDFGRDIWSNKTVSLPIICGIAFGLTWATAALIYDWKSYEVKVIEVASQTRVEIYRYTYHTCTRSCGKKCTTTYPCPSYDYNRMVHKTELGYGFPDVHIGIDYELGTGYQGETDDPRIVYFRMYYLGRGDKGAWFLCESPNLNLEKGKSYEVNTDYFDEIASAKGILNVTYEGDSVSDTQGAAHVAPVGGSSNRAIVKGFKFFGKMFTDPAYVPLRMMYLLVYGVLILIAVFFQETRQGVGYFVITSLIIPFIIILISAVRSGRSLSDFRFGGGSFGGGGAGGRF